MMATTAAKTKTQVGTLTLEQVGSAIGRPHQQRETLKGLGLNKLGRRSTLTDTPEVRGMVAKVAHLVKIV